MGRDQDRPFSEASALRSGHDVVSQRYPGSRSEFEEQGLNAAHYQVTRKNGQKSRLPKFGDHMNDPFPNEWDFASLLRLVEDHPMAALKQCRHYFSSKGFGHHEHIYHLCAAVVGFARKAQTEQGLQIRLYNSDVFASRKYPPKPKNILRHSFQWAMQAPNDSVPYDSACIYTTALQSIFLSDLPIDEIVATIRESGGLYKMEEVARNPQDESRAEGSADVRLIPAIAPKPVATSAAKRTAPVSPKRTAGCAFRGIVSTDFTAS